MEITEDCDWTHLCYLELPSLFGDEGDITMTVHFKRRAMMFHGMEDVDELLEKGVG
jgi:hypothetical protein